MNKAIFIDTSGFYSLVVKVDSEHETAAGILNAAGKDKIPFITTDYVLDETATLLRARKLSRLVGPIFDIVFASHACRIEWMDEERFRKTSAFFFKHNDQEWSFTDCFSFIVMKENKLSQSLTKDKHFTQAGFVPMLC
jgi:predicted nucleic acid-binding protein